ncbi:hypothetical protein SBA4_3110009 [Candidatus Sulfopaludibacter sp. SbA4]|nr:hypothetical protein SBA4_3110009 [Candidatus Sulfopaludibacter sp. SbA4]
MKPCQNRTIAYLGCSYAIVFLSDGQILLHNPVEEWLNGSCNILAHRRSRQERAKKFWKHCMHFIVVL